MAISTPKLVAIAGVLVISVILAFTLLYSSIVPQYSIAEFYQNKDRSTLVDKKIQLVGDVTNWNTTNSTFNIMDWLGTNATVGVHYDKSVQIPGGFTLEKRVVVEGILKDSSTNGYYLDATMISTKCPSKYQTQTSSTATS